MKREMRVSHDAKLDRERNRKAQFNVHANVLD